MKTKLKRQLQSIANIPQDRVYFDVPDELVDEMFDLYDSSDLYSYLTQKERNQAYKDMQGIGANSRQVQMEWKKKALWRIAKANAWDDLYELDESITSQILAGKSVRAVLMEALDKDSKRLVSNAEFFDSLDQSKEAVKEILDKAGVGTKVSILQNDGTRIEFIKQSKNDWRQLQFGEEGFIISERSVVSQVVAKRVYLEKDNLFAININEAVPLTKSRKILAVRDELQKNGSVEIDDKEIAMMYKSNKNPYMHFEVEELAGGKYRITVEKGNKR